MTKLSYDAFLILHLRIHQPGYFITY